MTQKEKIEKKHRKRNISHCKKEIRNSYSKWHESKIFYAYHYFGEGHSWADIYFLGRFKGETVVWNCTIEILRAAYLDKVEEIVREKIEKMFPEKPDLLESFMVDIDEKRGVDISERKQKLEESQKLWTEEKNNQYWESYKKLIDETADSGEIKVCENYNIIDDKYAYGNGLNIIVDADWLTVEVVEAAINKFNSMEHNEFGTFNVGEPKSFSSAELKEKQICPGEPIRY